MDKKTESDSYLFDVIAVANTQTSTSTTNDSIGRFFENRVLKSSIIINEFTQTSIFRAFTDSARFFVKSKSSPVLVVVFKDIYTVGLLTIKGYKKAELNNYLIPPLEINPTSVKETKGGGIRVEITSTYNCETISFKCNKLIYQKFRQEFEEIKRSFTEEKFFNIQHQSVLNYNYIPLDSDLLYSGSK